MATSRITAETVIRVTSHHITWRGGLGHSLRLHSFLEERLIKDGGICVESRHRVTWRPTSRITSRRKLCRGESRHRVTWRPLVSRRKLSSHRVTSHHMARGLRPLTTLTLVFRGTADQGRRHMCRVESQSHVMLSHHGGNCRVEASHITWRPTSRIRRRHLSSRVTSQSDLHHRIKDGGTCVE
jgi:hypothetical protein